MTEGGVNGDRLCLGEGSLWAGSEMNIVVGAKANFDALSAKGCDEESSDGLLLLFEATVNGNQGSIEFLLIYRTSGKPGNFGWSWNTLEGGLFFLFPTV